MPWLIFKRDVKSEKWAQFFFSLVRKAIKVLALYDQTHSLHMDEWTGVNVRKGRGREYFTWSLPLGDYQQVPFTLEFGAGNAVRADRISVIS